MRCPPLAVLVAAALVMPSQAAAAEPIMPLGDVRAGARCTGLSVIRGTEISSFDVEVLDVIDPQRGSAARILVRASGAAVDRTGLGPGFSGSPVLCPGEDGVVRTIGAISETIGEYGGLTALATPIETMLAQPLQPPSGVRARAGTRTLASPLTISGLSPSLARRFVAAARRAGRVLIASPAGTRAAHPPQPLVPGAAVSVGLTSGDISIGAIGTVAYADGASVYVFGHELDGAGRRSLFLQDAYIHTVVNNPIAVPDASTYKLGSPGNDVGIVSSDAIGVVGGTVGAGPPSFPLTITARDRDTGAVRSSSTQIADEGDVGLPVGISALAIAGSAAVGEVAGQVLGGAPARQTGDMCVQVRLRERRQPLRFCNDYAVAGAGPNALAGAAAADMAAAIAIVESYRFGTLHPTAIEVGLRVRRGMRQAYIVGAEGPRSARPGQQIRLRLRLRRTQTGTRFTRTVRFRVPADARRGPRALKISGLPADSGSNPNEESDLSILFEEAPLGTDSGPQSVQELAERFAALHRYDGVSVRFGGRDREAYRDPDLRISGEASLQLTIRRGATR